MKTQNTQNSQNNMNSKVTSGGITILELKQYYRAIWNKIKDAEINPYTYGDLIFDKAETIQLKKGKQFQQMVLVYLVVFM